MRASFVDSEDINTLHTYTASRSEISLAFALGTSLMSVSPLGLVARIAH